MNFDIPVLTQPPAIVITFNEKQEPEKPKEYTVIKGDTLSSIATSQNKTVQRLWQANLQLTHPDVISVGETIKLPADEEVLAEREMPVTIQPVLGTTAFGASKPLSGGFSSLIGSIGYAKPYGNCVNEPGVNSPHNGTNPISWAVLSKTPTIGATALWTYNHTGVVVGIWSNGDIEVRHQNFWGGQHRFPRSAFRGFR